MTIKIKLKEGKVIQGPWGQEPEMEPEWEYEVDPQVTEYLLKMEDLVYNLLAQKYGDINQIPDEKADALENAFDQLESLFYD